MPRVIVFDLNETLIDMSGLDPEFARVFGRPDIRKDWFQQVLQLFLTATVVDRYRNFETLADSALKMVGEQRGTDASMLDRKAILSAMADLRVYPDARPALERLKAAGRRVATLTNSTERSARAHLERNDLSDFFDAILSVDAVQRFKPAREAYEYAAMKLDVDLGDIRLVAAHSWDCAGALAAGCKAAFIRRPGKVLDPDADQPDIIGDDLGKLVDAIIERDR